jgi:hypothetical protein
MRSTGVISSTPSIAASRSAARRAIAAPRAYTQSSPTNMLSQPIERAIPTIDGRWKFDDSNFRASGQRTATPPGATVSNVKCPPKAG